MLPKAKLNLVLFLFRFLISLLGIGLLPWSVFGSSGRFRIVLLFSHLSRGVSLCFTGFVRALPGSVFGLTRRVQRLCVGLRRNHGYSQDSYRTKHSENSFHSILQIYFGQNASGMYKVSCNYMVTL